MRRYHMRIVLADGSRSHMTGLFANDWQAIDAAFDAVPETAVSIVLRRGH